MKQDQILQGVGGLSAASEHQLGVDAWWQGAISDGTSGGDSTSDAWRRAREREMGLQVCLGACDLQTPPVSAAAHAGSALC